MQTYANATRFWKQGLAALGVLAGLALAPAPAQASVCGDLEDIAEDLVEEYLEEYEGFFTLSQETCNEMQNSFYKACTTAVKDAVKCIHRQIDSLAKAAKPACKENFENSSECTNEFKEQAEFVKNIVSGEAEFANDDCDDEADFFWGVCRFGDM